MKVFIHNNRKGYWKEFGGHRKLPLNFFRKLIQPLHRVSRKIQRNEICPCGSGLKYKHCCIKKVAA